MAGRDRSILRYPRTAEVEPSIAAVLAASKAAPRGSGAVTHDRRLVTKLRSATGSVWRNTAVRHAKETRDADRLCPRQQVRYQVAAGNRAFRFRAPWVQHWVQVVARFGIP
jgi:hypothetical protein